MNKENYLEMQRLYYENEASGWSLKNKDPVVGSYHKHNTFSDYETMLFPIIDTKNMVAMEYGCGPARNIIRFYDKFKQIDGVDISEINIKNAKINIEDANLIPHNLYVNNGCDIPINDETYDLVFSTICLQHICVYEIRFKIMEEIYRVLKKDGYFCFQMGYGSPKENSVDYYENNYGAKSTNGGNDVSVGDYNFLKQDLEKIGFKDFSHTISVTGPGDGHGNWIWVQVKK